MRDHEYTVVTYRKDGSELPFHHRRDPYQLRNHATEKSASASPNREHSQEWRKERHDSFESFTWYHDRWTTARNITMTPSGVRQDLGVLRKVLSNGGRELALPFANFENQEIEQRKRTEEDSQTELRPEPATVVSRDGPAQKSKSRESMYTRLGARARSSPPSSRQSRRRIRSENSVWHRACRATSSAAQRLVRVQETT